MKKRLVIALLLLLVVCFWVWRHRNQPADQVVTQPAGRETNQAYPPPSAGVRTSQASAPRAATDVPEQTPESDPAAWVEKRLKEIAEERQRGLNEWRTPIEFYGRVVDENTNAVVGAQVDFDCNDTSTNGTSFYHAQSDVNGLFSIRDIQGKLLGVVVSRQGYYASRADNNHFEYGDPHARFVPEERNPVVFHLRKKGAAEPLIHLQAPMGGPRGFRVARDGTPLEISLRTGQTVPLGGGDIRVGCQTDDQGKPPGQKYDWKCQISVPNGGILEYTNEYPFQAPLAGYQPSDEVNMPANAQAGWRRNARRNYFLKLADGAYARTSFEMIAGGDHFFQVESFLNPSGSRNLEYDPSKTIAVDRQ